MSIYARLLSQPRSAKDSPKATKATVSKASAAFSKLSAATEKFAFFSIKTQFDNVGDALINREMIRLAANEASVFVDLSRCPREFRLALGVCGISGVTSLQERGSRRLLIELVKARLRFKRCFYFLSPGGYVGELEGGRLLQAWLNTVLLVSMYLIGVRICHVGVSYERIGPSQAKLIRLRSLLLHCHFLRDKNSSVYARELRIRHDGIIPDLAFSIFVDSPRLKDPNGLICFSFRTDQTPTQFQDAHAVMTAVAAEFPMEASFVLFAQVGRDVAAMHQLAKLFHEATGRLIQVADCCHDIEGCLTFYDRCSVVISNRLHVLLMASSRIGRIVACVSGDANSKIDGLFKTIRHERNVVRMDQHDGSLGARIAAVAGEDNLAVTGRAQREDLKRVFRDVFA